MSSNAPGVSTILPFDHLQSAANSIIYLAWCLDYTQTLPSRRLSNTLITFQRHTALRVRMIYLHPFIFQTVTKANQFCCKHLFKIQLYTKQACRNSSHMLRRLTLVYFLPQSTRLLQSSLKYIFLGLSHSIIEQLRSDPRSACASTRAHPKKLMSEQCCHTGITSKFPNTLRSLMLTVNTTTLTLSNTSSLSWNIDNTNFAILSAPQLSYARRSICK